MYPVPGPRLLRDLFIITTNSISIYYGLVLASLGFIVHVLRTPKNHSMYNSRRLTARKLVGKTVKREARDGFIVLNARIELG